MEAPLVRNLRVDLLGESPAGDLVHIERQSRNEKDFPLRMGQYSFGVALRHGRLPRQVALCVGAEPLRMPNHVAGPGGLFTYHIVDIRDLDGEQLLAGENVGDNVIALITRLGSERSVVKWILARIAEGPPDEREAALAELVIVAGLRKMDDEVRREARLMPIQEDIMDHGTIGPAIRKGRAEGQLEILTGLIEQRFGVIPPEIRKRLASMEPDQVKAASCVCSTPTV